MGHPLKRTRHAAFAALLVALLLAFAGFVREASAARVTGSVRMPAPGAAPPSDDPSGYWRAWNGFLELRPPALDPRSEVLVVLRGGDLPEPRGCAYRLQQGDFAPKAMAVRPGATLRIENRDGCSHELTSASIPEFPPLATAPGNARAIAGVPGGGPHAITDRLYGHVGGWVHVMDDLAACATMAADGRYVFEDVPAGRYRLVVLRGETEVRSADVEVRSNGLTVDPIAIP